MKKGFLVTFEGGEGCGKSTQIKLFEEYLQKQNYDYIMSKEPGATELGSSIRNLVLHSKGEISSMTELFLMTADRSDHIQKVVKPALAEGKVVVLDRYYHSCYAYQGYAGNIDLEKIKKITEMAIEGAVPDLVILLDLPIEVGFERKSKNENLKNLDRMELKGLEFHKKVREGYLDMAKKEKNFAIIDASQPIEKVFEDIKKAFENAYKNA